MDFRQLRYFQQVYLDGSIQKASRSLYVSQQAVSRTLINLETELGVSLFIRDARGVTPTQEARMLMRETRDLLVRMDAISYGIKSGRHSICGTVRLGALVGHMGARSRLNIAAIEQCRAAYPQIELIDENDTPDNIEKKILSGAMDFGFSAFPSNPELFDCRRLFDFKWFMVMGHDHPLAARSRLIVEDLAGQTLIFPKNEQYDRQQIVRSLSGAAEPTFLDAHPTLYDVVFQQLLPKRAMMLCAEPHAPLLNPEIVRLIPFHTDLLRSRIFLLCRKDAQLSEAARQVLDYLLNCWKFLGDNEC